MKFNKKIAILQKIIRTKYLSHPFPFFVEIELTTRCNLRCKICNQYKKDPQDIDKDALFSFLDRIEKDVVFVSLTGGEPLLYKKLKEVIDYIQDKDGILVQLNTNGHFLNKSIPFLNRVDLLSVSLNHPKSIPIIKDGLIAAKNSGVFCNISTTINTSNLMHLDTISQFAKRQNIPLHVRKAKYAGDRSGNKFGMLSASETKKLEKFYRTHTDQFGLPLCSYLAAMGQKDVCPLKKKGLYIDVDGFVHPCWASVSSKKIHISTFSRRKMDQLEWPACNVCCPDFYDLGQILQLKNPSFQNMIDMYKKQQSSQLQ